MSALRWAESVLLQLPMRLALGGAFVFAAYMKITNVQAFAFAIKGFKIVDTDKHANLIITAAYTMPWVEMIAGVLLILGLKARAASATIGLLLALFIAALLYVIYSPAIDADCSCFGKANLFCDETVGWCQVNRDLIMLVPALYLLVRGGGNLGLDALCDAKNAAKNPTGDAISGSEPNDSGFRG
jgi:putative oxidoreductase